jgi:hypothetical protein
LFEAHVHSGSFSIDVTKEGRFLLPARVEQEAATPMTVVLNWVASLPKRR